MHCHQLSRKFILVAAMFLMVFLPLTANAGTRIALVIGNSKYTSIPTMPKSITDANLMTKKLTELGFQVTEILDADKDGMIEGFANFKAVLDEDSDVALIYFSGRGAIVNESDSILPIDKSGEEPNWLSSQEIVSFFADNDNTVKIVILETDRSSLTARDSKSGRTATIPIRNLYFAYATAPGSDKAPSQGKANIFTSAIVELIGEAGLGINRLFSKIRKTVFKASNGKQSPWNYSSLSKDFVFKQ